MHGLPIVSRWPIAIEWPVIRKVFRSKLMVYAPCRYSDVVTNCPVPVRASRHQCRADRRRQRHAGRVVAHPAALERRRVAGPGQQVRQARPRPERGDVVGGPVGVGPASRRTR